MINNNSAVDSTHSQALLNQIVIEYMHEQKRKRFWQWIKRGVIFLLILFAIYLSLSMRAEDAGLRASPHVGFIDVKGTIFDKQSASADNFMKGLDKAYDNKGL